MTIDEDKHADAIKYVLEQERKAIEYQKLEATKKREAINARKLFEKRCRKWIIELYKSQEKTSFFPLLMLKLFPKIITTSMALKLLYGIKGHELNQLYTLRVHNQMHPMFDSQSSVKVFSVVEKETDAYFTIKGYLK